MVRSEQGETGGHLALRRLGQRLRRARLQVGLSQQELIASIGISAARLESIEQGREQIRGSELFDFARVCGVPFDHFTAGLLTTDADGLTWAGGSKRVLGRFDSGGRAAGPDGPGAGPGQKTPRRPGAPAVHAGPRCGRTDIVWDAERVSAEALRALEDDIATAPEPAYFRLRFNYGGWAEENLVGKMAALARVRQIMAHVGDPRPEDVRIDRHPPGGTETERISAVFRLWQRGEGGLDRAGRRCFDELSSHLLIFEDLRYRHIGSDSLFVRTGGHLLAEECIGLPYDYDPAQEAYSRSVCRDYESVLADHRPRYDHICAKIEVGTERRWLVYQRVIAPFRLSNGRPILAVLCDPTPKVTIPFLGSGPEAGH